MIRDSKKLTEHDLRVTPENVEQVLLEWGQNDPYVEPHYFLYMAEKHRERVTLGGHVGDGSNASFHSQALNMLSFRKTRNMEQ
jgi:hypothetical protein